MKKPYQRTDVNVFREILKNKFCPDEEKGTSKKVLLEMIQQINKVEIKINGLNINKNSVIENINFKEFGIKERNDVKIEFIEDLFNDKTKMIIKSKVIYDLEDFVELPRPINNKQKQYLALMSDTFERIKIKAENILEETDEPKNIEIYANKNIQKIARIFYDAKILLQKVQRHNDQTNRFFLYVQNIFIINTILYFQKMFSAYYKEKNYSQNTLKSQLFDSVGINLFMEPTAEYGKQEEGDEYMIWTGQINVLVTMYYDLMQKGLIKNDAKYVEDYIYKNYRNKHGKRLSRATINTCLKEYRSEKRAPENKKIDISKYIETSN